MKHKKNDGVKNATARDSNGQQINENDLIYIHSTFYYSPSEFLGYFLSLDVNMSGGKKIGSYFIKKMNGDVINVDVGLKNDLTPFIRNVSNPEVTVTNLSRQLEQHSAFSPTRNRRSHRRSPSPRRSPNPASPSPRRKYRRSRSRSKSRS